MFRNDVRSAMAQRDGGMRKISKYTWWAGAVGLACSALVAVAFGQHPGSKTVSTHGTILIPAQPPAPAQGAGQVTSGAS
jgi:hypothetical protein